MVSINKYLIKIDQFCDLIPYVSTATNAVTLIFKATVVAGCVPKAIQKNSFAKHLRNKSKLRCVTLLVPRYGNIAFVIYKLFTLASSRGIDAIASLPPSLPRPTQQPTPASQIERFVADRLQRNQQMFQGTFETPKASQSSQNNNNSRNQNLEGKNSHKKDELRPIQVTSQVLESKLDKEFQEIKNLWDIEKQESLYAQLAEKYLSLGCLDKALKTINELYRDTKTKEKFIVKVAQAYLNKGNRENAIKSIDKIYSDTKTKESFYVQVAESYYVEGDLEKALKMIDKLYSDTKTKEPFIVKVAQAYLNKRDREKAIKTFDKIYSDTKTKESFYVHVAESYYVEGDLEKALKMIDKLYSDTKTKETFIVKVAHAYIIKGDLEKALKVINKLYSDTKTKESFYVQVAESYYVVGDLEKALKVIDKLYSDTKTKETFIIKVAHAYLNKGDREKAVKAIYGLIHEIHEKFAILIQIAQSYFSENNEKGVLKAIEEIARDSLKDKICKTVNHSIYFQIMMDNIASGLAKTFFENLAKDCFAQAKVYFANHNAQAILQEIAKKSTDHFTLQAFLGLNRNQSYAKNESSKSETASNRNQSYPQNETGNVSANPKAPYYSILGLAPTATREDVRKAYKNLSLKYHPDKVQREGKESDVALEDRRRIYEERFKLISEAHQILTGS